MSTLQTDKPTESSCPIVAFINFDERRKWCQSKIVFLHGVCGDSFYHKSRRLSLISGFFIARRRHLGRKCEGRRLKKRAQFKSLIGTVHAHIFAAGRIDRG
jgi:hypothetical protein